MDASSSEQVVAAQQCTDNVLARSLGPDVSKGQASSQSPGQGSGQDPGGRDPGSVSASIFSIQMSDKCNTTSKHCKLSDTNNLSSARAGKSFMAANVLGKSNIAITESLDKVSVLTNDNNLVTLSVQDNSDVAAVNSTTPACAGVLTLNSVPASMINSDLLAASSTSAGAVNGASCTQTLASVSAALPQGAQTSGSVKRKLKHKVKKAAWSCAACTLLNPASVTICQCCDTPARPAKNPGVTKEELSERQWSCMACSFLNHPEVKRCESCAIPANVYELYREMVEKNVQVSDKLEIGYPEYWTKPTSNIECKKVLLELGSNALTTVTTFLPQSAQVQLFRPEADCKVERVENVSQYQLYAVRKAAMDRANNGEVVNERWLWHGTDATSVSGILHNGFNRGYCGKNGTRFGKGVYFANDFNYSAQDVLSRRDFWGYKTLLLCRVLTGTFAAGCEKMVEPPLRFHSFSSQRHNSVVDNVKNPTIFVIFHDAQVYPEYVLTYKP